MPQRPDPSAPQGDSEAGEVVASSDRLAPGDGLVIGLLVVSTFIVLLNEMLLGVALPTLVEELEITAATGQWLTTGYLLTLAILIPATGFTMRRFHLRTIFLWSMTLFSLGTVIAAAAPGFEVLFVGRIVQAAGAASLLPLLMATTMRLVPPSRQGRMMALVTVVTAAAPAVGPAASGLVISELSWRWLFILTLPVALGGLALGAVRLRNITTPEHVTLDRISLLLSAIGFGGLIYGLASIGESVSGHVAVPPLVPLGIGLLGIGAFVWRQVVVQRSASPFLDMRIFAVRSFSIPLFVMVFVTMIGFGTVVILPFVLHDIIGLSTLEVGLFLVPGGIVISGVSAIGGRVYDRHGPRPLAIPGALLLTCALWSMTRVDESTSVITLLVTYLLVCAGQAFMWTPMTTTALGALRADLYPHGSAAFNAVQQLAGAAGAAVLVSAYTIGSGTRETGSLSLEQSVSAAQAAFTASAVLSFGAILGTLFVRRNALTPVTDAVDVPPLPAPAPTPI